MSNAEHLLAQYGNAFDERCPEITTSELELRLRTEQEADMATETLKIPDVDDPPVGDPEPDGGFWRSGRRRLLAAAAAALLVVIGVIALVQGEDDASPVITDEVPDDEVPAEEVSFEPTRIQDADLTDRLGAEMVDSTVVVRADGDRADFEISVGGLEVGHVVSAWVIAVDPDACVEQFPTGELDLQFRTCASTVRSVPELGNVGFLAGGIVAEDGRLELDGTVLRADGLTNQWFETPLVELDRTMFQVALKDHGEPVEGLLDEMLTTYRGGCANTEVDLPAVPEADGTPGPNLCREVVFANFNIKTP